MRLMIVIVSNGIRRCKGSSRALIALDKPYAARRVKRKLPDEKHPGGFSGVFC
jgi:hypothetical protein